jgi:acetoin utilization protein AcuC
MAANVIHPAVFRRPATSAGGALLAAEMLLGGRCVHAPGVGNHHGFADHASGFCFVNDISLLILRLRDAGIRRIAYLDLDAHHGDGVEAAFAENADILTMSVHEAGRWPRTGLVSRPETSVYNFAVPAGLNDSELVWLWTHRLKKPILAHEPEVILLLPGADALVDDVMCGLGLSNLALWDVLRELKAMGRPLAVLGGGGYNPYALARCWAGLWAVLNDLPVPEILPAAAQTVLAGIKNSWRPGLAVPPHWITTLADEARPGKVRREIVEMGA